MGKIFLDVSLYLYLLQVGANTVIGHIHAWQNNENAKQGELPALPAEGLVSNIGLGWNIDKF